MHLSYFAHLNKACVSAFLSDGTANKKKNKKEKGRDCKCEIGLIFVIHQMYTA